MPPDVVFAPQQARSHAVKCHRVTHRSGEVHFEVPGSGVFSLGVVRVAG
jgi:hypothetical protein